MQRPLNTEWSFFFFSGFMKLRHMQDIQHLLLFVENHDGRTFNQLLKDLCVIYAESQEGNFDYMPSAVSRATTFIHLWYPLFWAKYSEDKHFVFEKKNEIISFVAVELAQSALNEFKLGNVY